MCLSSVISDTLYPGREALAGGEEGNGLELWRNLFWEHEGGDTAVQIHGIRSFHAFPKCSNIKDLNIHLGQWFKLRAQYAFDMPEQHAR